MDALKARVPDSWIGQKVPYARDASIPSLFAERAGANSARPALVMGGSGEQLTYRELDQRSNALCAQLIELGIKPGDTVGLFMGRSIVTVVAMLATLKARAAYVPLDPAYPPERLRFMLDDVQPRVVLTDAESLPRVPSHSGKTVSLTGESASASTATAPSAGTSSDVAYIMYTSGSTGKPKGVAVPQRGITRLVLGTDYTRLSPAPTFLQLAPISFDASTLEIWAPLLHGGTCVLFPSCGVPDLTELGKVIAEHGVTHMWLTASLFNLIVDERPQILKPVRELMTGGEALSVPHIRKAYAQLPETQLINGYGPTESTTFACCYRIPRDLPQDLASIPIGTPIANTMVYVLDDARKPVAVGEPGELYIGGDGLAQGYWKRPELTAERFVPSTVSSEPDARMYKTGDRVRWLPSGIIEFLGRNDDQVKLSGHRIELGEVSAVLARHPDVGDAVAMVREDTPGHRRLVAYVTARDPKIVPSAGSLRSFLEERMPDYMVPSFFVAIERIPLTANGKADKAALPRPGSSRPELGHAFVAPRTQLETLLADLWTELLELERVGVHDKFFELGGTSLLAVQLMRRLNAALGHEIPLVALFDAPTIAEIGQTLVSHYPAAVSGRFDLSAQRVAGEGAAPARRNRKVDGETVEIAVVGMAGRFPKAKDIHAFWRNLEAGVEASVQVTAEDLEHIGKDPKVLADPDYVAATFALDQADCFDAAFFGFSPREAEVTDPQIRLMLETAWSALEHAGYDPARYEGRIGVFGGVGRNSYLLNQMVPHKHLRDTLGEYHMLVGNERDFPTTHISYRMNLSGPSVDVQTACSTSGVAIHLACQSLRSGDSDMALVGGCKIICPNKDGYWYIEGGPLAPEGHLRAFSADAKGMVRGSGAAILVLKRLDDAIADGDTVYGLIKGSAINNDGSNKIGFTAPSVRGQANVIVDALEDAGVGPDQIDYVEAHGTGTKIGDPIEVAALTRAYRTRTERTGYCAIGSVKTNIGHLDAAATAAGVIKTLLAFNHEKLPASLNFKEPNPEIDFERSPFYVNAALRDWPRKDTPRRAGVSSFGLGGTNVHVILEEAPSQSATSPGRKEQLLVWSAKTPEALVAQTAELGAFLNESKTLNLADVAFTLQEGRRAFPFRAAVAVSSIADGAECLSRGDKRRITMQNEPARTPTVAFMFPGGGAQYANMARGLYEAEPLFRSEVDTCAELLKPIVGLDIRTLMFPEGDGQAEGARMESPSLALPTLFTIEYALGKLWMQWGVKPSAMIGHSMGEYAAACLSGVMSLADALALVCCRGRLFEKLPEGGMLSVPLGEADARKHMNGGLCFAAINRPNQCVLSGPVHAIEAAQKKLEREGIESTRIRIHVAAHSHLVEPILTEFLAFLRTIKLNAPRVPFVSNVSGTWITEAEATSPEYWVSHLRSTVRFSDGLTTLLGEGERALLEVGPGQTLSTFARQHPARPSHTVVTSSLRHPQESVDDARFLASALGKLWTAGVEIDWKAYHVGETRRRVGLPSYPFARTRYWIDAPRETEAVAQSAIAQVSAPATMLTVAAPMTAAPAAASVDATLAGTAAPSGSRRGRIVQELQRIVGDLSGLTPSSIDPHTSFLELGFDSLFLTQANAQFKSAFGVRMTVRQLLEKTPCLDALAERLDQELPAAAFKDEPAAAPAPVSAGAPVVMGNAPPGSLQSVMEALAMLTQQVAQLAGGAAPSAPAPRSAPIVASAPKIEAPAASATPDRTSPWQPVQKTVSDGSDGLTERQRAHLTKLLAKVQERTPTSKKLTQENRAALSDPRTVQGFRRLWKEIVYPIVSDKAQGSRIWDVDGNEYIDLVNGYGVTFFGHTPDFIIREVEKQLRKTVAIGPQTPLAGEVAQLVCELTGMDRAALCNTGSEAVLAAIRMARTVTGRRRLATFSGHYHGIFDEVLVKGVNARGTRRSLPIAPGIRADVVADVIVMDYGDPKSFDLLRQNAHEIGLVMVEPIRSRNPANQPVEFLRELRKVTEELDIPLLMDEMVTGFRSHPGGVQALWGVRADIATYGKVVGGGFPIGVVAGSRKYMDALDGGQWNFGDDSQPEADMTWFAGTFVRHPPALAAAKAVLERLKREGPALQEGLAERVKRFADDLNAHFRATNTPMFIEYFSSFFVVKFDSFQDYSNLLFYHLHNRGVYTYEGRPAFITTEHTDADMLHISNAFKESVAELQRVGFLPGRPLQGVDEVIEIPLSDGQQEIWLATRFGDEASMAFNLASTLHLRGELNAGALQSAVDALVARHEALRAVPGRDGRTQRILPLAKAHIEVQRIELKGATPQARDAELQRVRQAEVETPFDLDNGPLLRAKLVVLGPDEHLFILTAHHIIADGWSCGILLRDLGKLYEAATRGEVAKLPPAMQLSEWVERDHDPQTSEERNTALEFWLNAFKDAVPVLDIPSDRPRPPIKTYRAKRSNLDLDRDFTAQVRKLATKQGATSFATLLAAFQTFLYRLSKQSDLVIGFSLAGQSNLQGKDLVSHCVSFLPLRMSVEGTSTFADQIAQARGKVFDAVEHQQLTFGNLIKRLQLKRDPSRVPLMSVAFNLDPSSKGIAFGNLDVTAGSIPRRFENFDIFFNVVDLGDSMQIQCTYNEDLWDADTMARRLLEYRTLLTNAIESSDTQVDKIGILPKEERELVVNTWNPLYAGPQVSGTIHDRVSAAAARTPNAIAVTCGEERLSYAELEACSNQLAHHLQGLGVRRGDLVGICVERSIDMMVGILGILKSGAAYVPIDPVNPDERLAFIAQDSRVRVLLSQEALKDRFDTQGTPVLLLDAERASIASKPTTPLATHGSAEDLAYVIYTSGSTGKPKGVLVPHGHVLRLFDATQHWFHFDQKDVWTMFHSYAFDFSVWEIWGALMFGGKLVVVPYLVSRATDQFLELLEREGVTVLNQTPSAFWQLVAVDGQANKQRALNLRYVIFGGEALELSKLRPWIARRGDDSPQLVNMYGITETTVHVTYRRILAADVEAQRASVVGVPIPDLEVYIVDEQLNPTPIGVPGEILVGGAGVANGYLNRPELTAERFIDNPFRPGKKLYRSGDVARFLANRDIEYVGRADTQVKIRGFRIELGEIEAAIAAHPSVSQVAVIARTGDDGQKTLVAYCVPSTGAEIAADEVLGRAEHKEDWKNKWALLYQSGRESLEKSGKGEDAHLNDEAILDQLAAQEDFHAEWLEFQGQTMDRIMELNLGDMMEIGCGTGQVLLRIAPHAKSYYGTDFAELGIREIERQLASDKFDLPAVRVAVREGVDFKGVNPRSLDTIVINSVIQYFPDAPYLLRVLENAVEALRPGGCIYLGDVQSYEDLYTHHANDQLERVGPTTKTDQLRRVVDTRVLNEDELVVDPELFYAFMKQEPRVTRVELKQRRGKILNETTRYHYDVYLYVDSEPAPVEAFEPWTTDLTVDALKARLRAQNPELLCISKVPNGRVIKQRMVAELLKKPNGPDTAGELLAAAKNAPEGVDPEALWALAEDLSYVVDVLWTHDREPTFDVVFRKRNANGKADRLLPSRVPALDAQVSPLRFANSPHLKSLTKTLAQELRALSSDKLPDYMVPAQWVLLDALPLTANGKLDVRALPNPEQSVASQNEYVAPSTDTERAVAGLFSEVLRLERIGIRDNFFELGGHSLLAVQVIMRTRDVLDVDISLGTIFAAPTIESLSQAIDAAKYVQGATSKPHDQETEELVI